MENGRRTQNHQQEQEEEAPVRPSMMMIPQRSGDLLGRHRLSAAIARLDKEIQSLEKEMEELETMEPSSAACKQVVSSTELLPDALLPVTRGPEDASWERWFQCIRSSNRSHKWWTGSNRAKSSFS